MPTASERPKSPKPAKKLGGSASATNETPVSGDAEPNRRPEGLDAPPANPDPAPGSGDAHDATGRDHPSQSEQPKPLDKRNGVTAQLVDKGAHHRKFTQTFNLRQQGARGPKPSQKSKGR